MQSRGSASAIKDSAFTPKRRYDGQLGALGGSLVTTPKDNGRTMPNKDISFAETNLKSEIRVNDFNDQKPENARYGKQM